MKAVLEILVVCTGGAGGALLRYFIVNIVDGLFKSSFPWGTLLANLLGCLLIGLMLGGEHDQKNEMLRLSFGVGFLGALTTFSAFSAETVKHAIEGNWGVAVSNVFLNVAFCLVAVAIGIILGKKIWA